MTVHIPAPRDGSDPITAAEHRLHAVQLAKQSGQAGQGDVDAAIVDWRAARDAAETSGG